MKRGQVMEYNKKNYFSSKMIQKISQEDYSPCFNILALFNNLAQVRTATSKTILDI